MNGVKAPAALEGLEHEAVQRLLSLSDIGEKELKQIKNTICGIYNYCNFGEARNIEITMGNGGFLPGLLNQRLLVFRILSTIE